MLEIKNLTQNLITTTIIVSGIANFLASMTWAKDVVKSKNHGSTVAVRSSEQKSATSIHSNTPSASNKDTVTPVFLNIPSPYPDAWFATRSHAPRGRSQKSKVRTP